MKFAKLLAEKNNDFGGNRPATVAFLGDSVTHGCFECYFNEQGNIDTVFERSEAYAVKLGTIFSRLYPRAQCNIVNAGLSGGTAEQGVARLERDVLRFCPDLVVINFGLNDSGAGESYLPTYRRSMRTLMEKIKATGAECILLTPNMICDYESAHLEPRLRALAADMLAREQGKWLDKYVTAAKEVAQSLQVPVCDCYGMWKAMKENGVNTTELLANKLNHPTREMQWLFAYKLAETILLG